MITLVTNEHKPRPVCPKLMSIEINKHITIISQNMIQCTQPTSAVVSKLSTILSHLALSLQATKGGASTGSTTK